MADEETPKEETTEKAVAPAAGGRQVAAAAGGPAIVVVPAPSAGFSAPQVSRRRVMQIGFWTGLLVMLGGIVATTINNIYPRGVEGFGAQIFVGTVDQLEPGSFLRNLDAKAWIMRFDAEQAARESAPEGAIVALWHKCPHLGCTVPWRPEFSYKDPRNQETYSGWFRCPCHGSTYTVSGFRVFGPAPRSMDTFALTIDNGNIIVDTGKITEGGTGPTDNSSRAILP